MDVFPAIDFPDDLKKQRIWYAGNSKVIGPSAANVPFIVVGSCDLSCIHGRATHKTSQKAILSSHPQNAHAVRITN